MGTAATAIVWAVFYLSIITAVMSLRGAYVLAYLAYNPLLDNVSVSEDEASSIDDGLVTEMDQLGPDIPPEVSGVKQSGRSNTTRPLSMTSNTTGEAGP